MAASEESDKKLKGNIGDILIEYGHGITNEDLLFASKDKSAVDFVQTYSKTWCKCLKDTIRTLEKRAIYENDCMRATAKLFQGLLTSVSATPEAPLSAELIQFSRLIIDQAKETELHNTKRYRELIEVLKRQRTEFAKTRDVLKAKWKADLRRMVDAESALFKAKSAYFKCCQTGVRLREDLTTAQATLNESQASLLAAATAPPPISVPTVNGASAGYSSSTNTIFGSAENSIENSNTFSSSTSAFTPPSTVDPSLMNAVVKQKAKVEKLEKQLGDNDKKEMELMYAYKDSVEAANARLVELEKSRVEIICDTRLTVTKCDEVVSDSMAELISHLFVTRTKMLNQYEDIATKFQNYTPGKPYHELLREHIENGTDVILEKYQFEGYHDNPANAKDRGDAAFGKFVSRFAQLYSKDTTETTDGRRGQRNSFDDHTGHRKGRHSESESDGEGDGGPGGNTTVLSSLVQFGSNLFRPDLKKPITKGGKAARGGSTGNAAGAVTSQAEMDHANLAALEAAAEAELDRACFVLIQCINGIETQKDGLQTHGIYRVPASKIKVAGVVEAIRAAQETGYSSIDLSKEYAITLASTLKTRLIQLPEPLLSYNLYDQFVDVGKALENPDSEIIEEQAKILHNLIGQLSNANQRVAGLLFHHLKRVSSFESVNQMGAANLATMFGPTVLRRKPKFNVANMMEFVDNIWLMKAVELCIDRASDVFGPPSEFTVAKLLKIIRERTSERLSIESTSTSSIDKEPPCTPASSSNTPNTPAPSTSASAASSKSAAREAFFSDMSGESTRASQAISPPVLKVSHPRSEQPSPSPFDRKSTSSRTSEDSGKSSTPLYHPSVTLTINRDPTISETATAMATKSQESLPESSGGSSSGGGGLKRLISTKAQNLHQKLQNFSAESSSRAGRVFNTRKLLHSASLRNPPSQAASRNSPLLASTTPTILKEKTLEVDDCSYIDTGR